MNVWKVESADPPDVAGIASAGGVVFRSKSATLAGPVAERIEIPAPWVDNVGLVLEELARFQVAEPPRPGTGPVALGALPFDREAPATMFVPDPIWTFSTDGSRVSHRAVTAPHAPAPGPGHADPSVHEVVSTVPPAEWAEQVREATERISTTDLEKIVLSRELVLRTDTPLDPGVVLTRLIDRFPAAMAFSIDGFVGASPELLVERSGSTVRSVPMAGTAARSGDPERDRALAEELMGSEKNRAEHRITIDWVHDALLRWCSYLDAGYHPEVVSLANVIHLASAVEGRLSRPVPSALELAAILHPTPAVGGHPRNLALELMSAMGETGRGRYAGPVGWIDSTGDGQFAVGLRSAQMRGTEVVMRAGVGVVAGSEPEAELAETRAKFSAILGALLQP